MNKKEASKKLIYLLEKYHSDEIEKQKLIDIINEVSRPGLPIRGVLEDLRIHKIQEISDVDAQIVDDLLYFYG
jgi:hypothetical protein